MNMLTLEQTSVCKISQDIGDKGFSSEWTERKKNGGDLIISCHGDKTFTHRAVLMARSDYFKAMFSGGFAETRTKDLDLSDVFNRISELNCVLDYMYTGEIMLSTENIESILNASCHFLMNDLQEICAVFLKANVSPKTCVAIFGLAELYSLNDLRAVCLEVIVSWLPVCLWNSKEALQMSPRCLISLIRENIFDLVSDDIKTNFLKNWCQQLPSSSNEKVHIPQEIRDLLQISTLLDSSSKDSISKTKVKEEIGVSMEQAGQENVFLAVFTLPPLKSDRCHAEIHALILRLKKWKLVLRHIFNDSVKSSTVPSLIGVTNTTAFFFLRGEDMETSTCCVISVDLQTSNGTVISLPEVIRTNRDDDFYYGYKSKFFIWEGQLCMIISVDETSGLYRSNHKELCEGECCGECWTMLCDLDQTSSSEYLVKEYKGELYVWLKEYCICGSALSDIYLSMFKVTKTNAGKYEKTKLCGARLSSEELEYDDVYETDLSIMCDIVGDPVADTLSFIHLMRDHDEDGDLFDAWQNEHAYQQTTYTISSDSWSVDVDCKLDYPDVPNLFKTVKKYKTSLPLRQCCKRLVLVEDGEPEDKFTNPSVEKGGPEMCAGGLFYARSTSPYSSLLWQLNPTRKEWSPVGRLPYSLERFTCYLSSELSSNWVNALPNSHFEDFSVDIGQSAFYTQERHSEMKVAFLRKALSNECCAQKWITSWEKLYK